MEMVKLQSAPLLLVGGCEPASAVALGSCCGEPDMLVTNIPLTSLLLFRVIAAVSGLYGMANQNTEPCWPSRRCRN